jgi:hypothetical protein
MAGGGDASNGSLNRLFRFITGGNEAKQKIAMTTPVFMSGSDSNATMAFVLPAKYKASGAPNPTDGAVKVRELEAGLLQLSCDLKHGILIACRQHDKTAFYRLLPRARR